MRFLTGLRKFLQNCNPLVCLVVFFVSTSVANAALPIVLAVAGLVVSIGGFLQTADYITQKATEQPNAEIEFSIQLPPEDRFNVGDIANLTVEIEASYGAVGSIDPLGAAFDMAKPRGFLWRSVATASVPGTIEIQFFEQGDPIGDKIAMGADAALPKSQLFSLEDAKLLGKTTGTTTLSVDVDVCGVNDGGTWWPSYFDCTAASESAKYGSHDAIHVEKPYSFHDPEVVPPGSIHHSNESPVEARMALDINTMGWSGICNLIYTRMDARAPVVDREIILDDEEMVLLARRLPCAGTDKGEGNPATATDSIDNQELVRSVVEQAGHRDHHFGDRGLVSQTIRWDPEAVVAVSGETPDGGSYSYVQCVKVGGNSSPSDMDGLARRLKFSSDFSIFRRSLSADGLYNWENEEIISDNEPICEHINIPNIRDIIDDDDDISFIPKPSNDEGGSLIPGSSEPIGYESQSPTGGRENPAFAIAYSTHEQCVATTFYFGETVYTGEPVPSYALGGPVIASQPDPMATTDGMIPECPAPAPPFGPATFEIGQGGTQPRSAGPPPEPEPEPNRPPHTDGEDSLTAGHGPDELTGGEGKDWFVFRVNPGWEPGNTLDDGDRITDYESGEPIVIEGETNVDVGIEYDEEKDETRLGLDFDRDGEPDKTIILDGDQRGRLEVNKNCCGVPTTDILIHTDERTAEEEPEATEEEPAPEPQATPEDESPGQGDRAGPRQPSGAAGGIGAVDDDLAPAPSASGPGLVAAPLENDGPAGPKGLQGGQGQAGGGAPAGDKNEDEDDDAGSVLTEVERSVPDPFDEHGGEVSKGMLDLHREHERRSGDDFGDGHEESHAERRPGEQTDGHERLRNRRARIDERLDTLDAQYDHWLERASEEIEGLGRELEQIEETEDNPRAKQERDAVQKALDGELGDLEQAELDLLRKLRQVIDWQSRLGEARDEITDMLEVLEDTGAIYRPTRTSQAPQAPAEGLSLVETPADPGEPTSAPEPGGPADLGLVKAEETVVILAIEGENTGQEISEAFVKLVEEPPALPPADAAPEPELSAPENYVADMQGGAPNAAGEVAVALTDETGNPGNPRLLEVATAKTPETEPTPEETQPVDPPLTELLVKKVGPARDVFVEAETPAAGDWVVTEENGEWTGVVPAEQWQATQAPARVTSDGKGLESDEKTAPAATFAFLAGRPVQAVRQQLRLAPDSLGQVVVARTAPGAVETGPPASLLPDGAKACIARRFRLGGTEHYVVRMPQNLVDRFIQAANETGAYHAEPDHCVQKEALDDPHYRASGLWGQEFDNQWAIKRVGFDAEAAEDWPPDPAGLEPVTVAVIDSGLDWYHPDFPSEALWRNEDEVPGNGVDDDGNGYVDDEIGWDFIDQTPRPWDHDGHGTFVAGVIAAGQNNGTGIAGINPAARIMVLRALDPFGRGHASHVAEAIAYAVDNGARVINLSLGGRGPTRFAQMAIDHARARGVSVVVAAGNAGKEVSEYAPAGLEGVVTVTATDRRDERAGFSNWGPLVDIAAPGIDVLSLRARKTDLLSLIPGVKYEPGEGIVGDDRAYFRASGTSFAAPIVTGTMSLILAANPELTAEQAERMLLHAARDIETPGFDNYTGYGRLDATAALRAAPDYFVESRISGVSVVRKDGAPHLRLLGTTDADRFDEAVIQLGKGAAPDKWLEVDRKIEAPVRKATIIDLPARFFGGAKQWTIRLITRHDDGSSRESRFSLRLG